MERVVFLVDMNAFFITCEATRNPNLVGRPAAVAGDPQKRSGIVLAANYEARDFGVRTAMTLYEARQLCPHMLLVPPDHSLYEQKSAEVMRFLSGFTPLIQQNSIDEAFLDMTGCAGLHGPPLQAAQMIQAGIKSQLGLLCSIGIAPNKFLAKMASELKKPMGITRLTLVDVQERLWPLPVSALHGAGNKTTAKLAALGICSIGDLARVDVSLLSRLFGQYGQVLHRHARGLDDTAVTPNEKNAAKSIGRSTTLATDLTDLDQARQVVLSLVDDIVTSTRQQGKKGQTVQITLKYSDFDVITRQMQIRPSCATRDLYGAACRLLESYWNSNRPVRLIGVSLSGFSPDATARQLSLFDLPGQDGQAKRQDELHQAIDSIRDRYGSSALTYGKLLQKPDQEQARTGKNDESATRE